MTKTKLFVRLLQHAALAGAVLLLLPAAAAAQRGASGPPEHAAVDPINDGPNPYETIRDWGTLPDGRSWGSVRAVNVDIDGVHIWAGDRCGVQLVRRVRRRPDPVHAYGCKSAGLGGAAARQADAPAAPDLLEQLLGLLIHLGYDRYAELPAVEPVDVVDDRVGLSGGAAAVDVLQVAVDPSAGGDPHVALEAAVGPSVQLGRWPQHPHSCPIVV